MIFFLCGIFGWSSTPASFQVITRALLFEFRKLVSGRVNSYVDDTIGISLKSNAQRDVGLIRNFLFIVYFVIVYFSVTLCRMIRLKLVVLWIVWVIRSLGYPEGGDSQKELPSLFIWFLIGGH